MPPILKLGPHLYLANSNPAVLYRFTPFYHPYVCDFIEALNRDGLDGLLKWQPQGTTEWSVQRLSNEWFFQEYAPPPYGSPVKTPYPVERVSFDRADPYGLYNWELFFHSIVAIADRFQINQQFDQALMWLERIFAPADGSQEKAPARFWKVLPFREASQTSVQDELAALFDDQNKAALAADVAVWRDNEFNPHRIARSRIWTYPKAIVMKYIDCLIGRGDRFYHQYTVESLGQATLSYARALDILGDAPPSVKPRAKPKATTYEALAAAPGGLDAFSDAMVACENLVFGVQPASQGQNGGAPFPMLYFGIPKNDKLLKYWQDVQGRLENIRHCRNIEGVAQPIPLFGPAIDPDLLVRAAAAGVDLGTVLADLSAPAPHYRFSTMIQRAVEFCADVRSLGSSLLAALEKRDGEAMALLRSGQEIDLLKVVRTVKERQVSEATEAVNALSESKKVIEARLAYYTNIQIASLNIFETAHLAAMNDSLVFQAVQAGAEITAGVLHLIPEFKIGALTTIGSTLGGENIASAVQAFGASMGAFAGVEGTSGALASAMGGFQRRDDEWTLQKTIATGELEQVKKQILSAQFRLEIAQSELDNHDKQIDNAAAIDDFIHSKATNQELFDWMVAQTSAIYFQSYQLAYNMAKRAERAFQRERTLWNASFIQYGYWDSLNKGLLSGERLHFDLRRMEAAYLDQNKREYELTKHFSLAMSAPLALLMLKQTGQCFVEIPEAAFDIDRPGDILRTMSWLAITIPNVSGPYTGVNCKVTLVSNRVRWDPSLAQDYPYTGPGDVRFRHNLVSMQSIVTSTAQNDPGVFEPRDDRYLPFEGAGAISQWRIELPRETNRFDFDTVSDVVLHMRYTARDGGDELKAAAMQAVLEAGPATPAAKPVLLGPGLRLFSAKREFSSEWYRFLQQKDDGTPQKLTVDLNEGRFPYRLAEQKVAVQGVRVFFELKPGTDYDDQTPLKGSLTPSGGVTSPDQDFKLNPSLPRLIEANFPGGDPGTDWVLTLNSIPASLGRDGGTTRIDSAGILDSFILCAFSIK